MIPRSLQRLGLLVLAGALLASCATSGAAGPAAAKTQAAGGSFEALMNAGDLAQARAQVDAWNKEHNYTAAYEGIQWIREVDPDQLDDLRRLATACVGLGLFDEGAATWYAVTQSDPSDGQATWWVVYLLSARGDQERARAVADEAISRGADWGIHQLRLEITPDRDGQLALLDAFLARSPGHKDATHLKASLKDHGALNDIGRVVAGGGQVVTADLSDGFLLKVEINGYKARLVFSTSTSGLILGSQLARHVGVEPQFETQLRGLGGAGTSRAFNCFVGKVEVGELVLTDVPALINTNANDFAGGDGIIGPGLFPGYAIEVDRKGGELTLYPPEGPRPQVAEGATTQRYYSLGSLLTTGAVVRNRLTDAAWQTQMVISTGSSTTLYNMDYAELMGFGEIQYTDTLPMFGLSGTTRSVKVTNSELLIGGAGFQFRTFWALDGMDGGAFVPYGYLGRDVLSRFKMILDPQTHMVSLETYQD